MVAPAHQEQCVSYAISKYSVTHARACRLFNCSRNSKYFIKRQPVKDEPIKAAIQKAIGTTRRGRKKVISLIRRDSPEMTASKIRRVYVQQGFSLYVRPRARRVKTAPRPAVVPLKANVEWAIDFMHDSLWDGTQIRSLNIVDPYNRQCKGLFIEKSFPAIKVIEYMERVIEIYGKPIYIRSDNGPEFTAKKFQLWMRKTEIKWNNIEKGKPQQNCHVERFNRTAREDFFDANLFLDVNHAQQLAFTFQHEYNHFRPHESLEDKTPIEYAI